MGAWAAYAPLPEGTDQEYHDLALEMITMSRALTYNSQAATLHTIRRM
jgi:hypothetical protein